MLLLAIALVTLVDHEIRAGGRNRLNRHHGTSFPTVSYHKRGGFTADPGSRYRRPKKHLKARTPNGKSRPLLSIRARSRPDDPDGADFSRRGGPSQPGSDRRGQPEAQRFLLHL